jgi:hypothetical protein
LIQPTVVELTDGREGASQGDLMSRKLILVTGALLWTLVALDVVIHVAIGDLLVPAVIGIIGLSWLAVRRPHLRLLGQSA